MYIYRPSIVMLFALVALSVIVGGVVLILILIIASQRNKAAPAKGPAVEPSAARSATGPPAATVQQPASTKASREEAAPEPERAAPPVKGAAVKAWLSDESPEQRTEVTVYGQFTIDGQGVAGVPMRAVWHYAHSRPACEGVSGADGIASCTRNIGGGAKGLPVRVQVAFTHEGQTYQATTAFTPR